MSYVKKQFDALFSSENANYLSSDGSYFEVDLDADGLPIPEHCENIQLQVISATMWWNTPNINKNNQHFHFFSTSTNQLYDIVLPEGIYSIGQIATTIDREVFIACGIQGLFTITADDATSRITIEFKNATDYIDFSKNDTFSDLLGFDKVITKGGANHFIAISQNPAQFSDISYFLVESNLTNSGISINGKAYNIISRILITAHAGSQIVYSPYKPSLIDASPCRYTRKKKLTFTLLTNKLENANTNGEYWSIQVRFSYLIKQ